MSNSSLTRQDLSIIIGNGLDHFDTAIYGFIAPLLSKIFFPHHDPIVSLILAYSVLASSIVTRPAGAIIFSIVAKKWGAPLALSYSLIGVAIATILMSVIPSYETIGWIAPLMLTIARMLQGIFAEGETSIAKLYILENKPYTQALRASTLYQLSTMLGIIIASFMSTLLIIFNATEYWRLCFIFGGSTAIIGYYLRKNLTKIPISIKPKVQIHTIISNTISLIINNKMNILYVAVVNGFSYMTYAIPFIVMNSLIPLITSITFEEMMTYNTLLLVVDAALFAAIFPLIGWGVAKSTPRRVMYICALLLSITIIPLWWFVDNASFWYVTFIRVWIIVLGVIFACPLNIWVNNLLPASDKYLLSSISNAIGSSILGRFTPALCIALWHFTGTSISVAIYIAITAIVTIWALKKGSTQA
ncbi:MFS transporter [Candidatus Tisiphia endosymbiont of Nemotelus uliginosus]|uniref:MFS transporter n=1 Tax=Candidatus Tisiphia endosymbiont of Nemotelus uliginosus TaxID=3077926 RepID=UPI0035C93886